MATLTEILDPYFEYAIKGRGEQYFFDRKVHVLTATHREFSAKVKGTSDYSVAMTLSGNTLQLSCDCPYFGDNASCKHLWAAALAAKSKGCFPGLGINAHVKFASFTDDYDDFEYEPAEDNSTANDVFQYSQSHWNTVSPYNNAPSQRHPSTLDWKNLFTTLDNKQSTSRYESRIQKNDILYCLNATDTMSTGEIVLQIGLSQVKENGERTKFRAVSLMTYEFQELTNPIDRQIMLALFGTGSFAGLNMYAYKPTSSCRLPIASLDVLLPLLVSTDRFFILETYKTGMDIAGPLRFDAEKEWEFRLEVTEFSKKNELVMSGAFWKDDISRKIAEPMLMVDGGYLFWREGTIGRLKKHGGFQLLSIMRQKTEILIPAHQSEEFIAAILMSDINVPIALPESLRYEQVHLTPVPLLRISRAKAMQKNLTGMVYFIYEGHELPESDSKNHADLITRRLFHRDIGFESNAMQRLQELGFKKSDYWNYSFNSDQRLLTFSARKMPHVVSLLLAENWKVEAEGSLYRKPGGFSLSVNSSGIDWFDLNAECDYDGLKAGLPAILKALKKGERFIALGNGVIGLLPEIWLEKYARLAHMGEIHEDRVRFKKSQALIINMLLLSQPEARCDELFSRLRDELIGFSGIFPVQAPASFSGDLRPYQKEGLGWFGFLQRFGFGGCLADDMGLGKTIQALALLAQRAEMRRAEAPKLRPSLVVAPRSLIFNWKREAERFTPELRVLDFSHIERRADSSVMSEFDLILITYGTLRRDIEILSAIEFDYIILDEAQAIKNAASLTTKATSLLKSSHRIAMSGTPIENHLGELWSIFEFINPGMLGSSPAFRDAEAASLCPEDQTIAMLARALRPFILRRTKSQVATDLPQKTEETLVCEMDVTQRRIYNGLRDHYRANLLAYVKSVGINKARIKVLEALLRLRQAACHPALLDKKRIGEPSAKLETLLAQLAEVVGGGYKSLVFSQFTSMLAIVRNRLDTLKITYEYLDGSTRNRQARVDRFQNDPACPLFLISLKAGGLGLNLTAAEYVFLLDPWWNPAVEAQAIDRTHRIGQTKPVFAYRLICKDTVEEKVLELQKTKRALADSIIGADNGVLRSMGVEDLELLLG
jgi:superfamily II DNA or RNA helicase